MTPDEKHNEKIKLVANALDRASTTFGAGSVLPLLSWFRGPMTGPLDALVAGLSMVAFFVLALGLHFEARKKLERDLV